DPSPRGTKHIFRGRPLGIFLWVLGRRTIPSWAQIRYRIYLRRRSQRGLFLQSDVGVLDHLTPISRFGREELCGLTTRATDWFHLHVANLFADLRTLDDGHNISVDLVGESLSGAGRRNQSKPCKRFETGQARLGNCRDLR